MELVDKGMAHIRQVRYPWVVIDPQPDMHPDIFVRQVRKALEDALVRVDTFGTGVRLVLQDIGLARMLLQTNQQLPGLLKILPKQ